jgi:thiol-disulfide isomerase/thioredoxin
MKNTISFLIFIIAFTGFLSTQIIWDSFTLNAQNISPINQKNTLYEEIFRNIEVETTKKTKISLKDEKKPLVLLNFWASWCLPCLKEFPSLIEFQKKYGDKLRVIGINGDEEDTLKNISKIELKYKLNFESVDDSQNLIANKFLIASYPVSILYYRGKVIYVSTRIHNFMDSDFLKLVEKTILDN